MIRAGVWAVATAALAACAGAGMGRFASPVAPLAGCYALNYGPWPDGLREGGAAERGLPDPGVLPTVVELGTERVGSTDEVAVDGRIHEVRSHGRPGRGILHFWRMVESDSVVVWTGGPAGFRLDVGVRGDQVAGTARVFSETAEDRTAPLSGMRSPCPRQAPRGA